VDEGKDFTENLNPHSKEILRNVKLEPSMANAEPGERYQFLRKGFFYLDPEESTKDWSVYNLVVSLRDSWAKIQNKN
jgi:glutaminyl-tRNA synthetase